MSLRAISAAAEEPPDAAVHDLEEMRDHLRAFDPPLRILVLAPLVRRRKTRWLARTLSRRFWDPEQLAETEFVLALKDSQERLHESGLNPRYRRAVLDQVGQPL
jgi:hypothetical protein